MFRHSALLVVALLCVADAQIAAMTHNKTKTGNKIPKGTHQDKTNIRKVPGFSLCTAPYDAYIGGPNVAGTGAFSYPVYPGDCDDVALNEPEKIGSLSATCSLNPYEGIYVTLNRVSGTDATTNPFDEVGQCTGNTNCGYNPTSAPQFQPFNFLGETNVVPQGTDYLQLQAKMDEICANNIEAAAFAPRTAQCSAELRLSGDNHKNKHPGSGLTYDYTTTTFYEPAGSTYLTETQYGLGGGVYAGGANAGYVYEVDLYNYLVVTSVTCLYRPVEIETAFDKIYWGSGRFEKYAASKVDSVEAITALVDTPGDAENPLNPNQIIPQTWLTQLDVDYVKSYLHSSML